ncbi:MAG: choice-of-anchor tandem repeat GloVer-containing protein [Candidatus Omnitrophota bacterium]
MKGLKFAIIGIVIALLMAIPVHSEEVTILYEFGGVSGDAMWPVGDLVVDSGVLYGMTPYGGDYSAGTAFSIGIDGSGYTVLHDFDWLTGATPQGSLIIDSAMLYGMAYMGGGFYAGTVFSMQTDGLGFTNLYDFTWTPIDGQMPYGDLVLDSGTLYGMTSQGGELSAGTIFSIGTDGLGFTLLKEFSQLPADGSNPQSSLIIDSGTLYGMTNSGGVDGCGTIFSVGNDGSNFTTLYEFDGLDGSSPFGDLILDSGVLYGMTNEDETNEAGTIFSIGTDGSDFTVLHGFSELTDNGAMPYGDLILVGDTLYGMTRYGGVYNYGTIFSIRTDGSDFTIVHDFANAHIDGSTPYDSLILDSNVLYGMTETGGTFDRGVIFALPLATPPGPDEYVDLIKFDSLGKGLGECKTAGTHTFEVEIESEFEYIQVTTKAGRAEAVTQIGVGDDPVTDDLGFVIELVSVDDGVYTVAVSSTEETPKALSYVILGAGKAEGEADPVLVDYAETEGYVVETGDNLHAGCFRDKPAGPKPKNREAAAAPGGPSQEVLAKKAVLEEKKALATDARFTRKRQHMLDLFGMGPDGMPLKGPR